MMQMTYTAHYEQEEGKDVLYIPSLNSIRAMTEMSHLLLLRFLKSIKWVEFISELTSLASEQLYQRQIYSVTLKVKENKKAELERAGSISNADRGFLQST